MRSNARIDWLSDVHTRMLNTVQSLLSRGMAGAYLLNISVDCTNLLLYFLRLEVDTQNFILTSAPCITVIYFISNDIFYQYINDRDVVTNIGIFYNLILSLISSINTSFK
jgi:hypothetical protein